MAENAVINVQVEIGEVENKLSTLTAGVNIIKTLSEDIKRAISQGIEKNEQWFLKNETSISDTRNVVSGDIRNLTSVVKMISSTLIPELQRVLEEVKDAVEKQSEGQGAEILANIISGVNDANEMYKRNKKKVTEKNASGSLGTSEIGGTSDSSGDVGLGIMSGAFGLGSGFPNVASMGELAENIGNVAAKLKETAAAWGTQMIAKLADKAVDLQIIALYAADYAVQFGQMIANLALSAAAWVAETAAKVANTAAQWAQIAATTAWQAICVAATAVTTAFGAAMTFLTSPIGLVVIAITALIAIVVLLVKNWDTVKESIGDAMDWISVKVQEGIAFVESVFAGINEFLQGVFAKDWTEQFGAFGNVLNAFFANVENIWNAVKSIFSGIVGFVKSVFAGDWAAAWDSIVQVFKGIWDYLVSLVKAPINGIIGMINGLVQGVVDGINLVIRALNKINVDIPDWVPVVGGQSFGFNLNTLTAPKIPYLAKGAVLPANRPFLAVVGDQKHGTNVEAPLSTIQEAVALVMDDHIAAMMAGFQALLKEQQATRNAVENIRVGDSVIGEAAARYNRRMAIAMGTY